MLNVPYAQAVGKLTYASTMTGPDLAYVVGEVSQHSANPDRIHWNAVKRIFRYLKGTTAEGITYGLNNTQSGDPTILIGYTNVDWAGEIDGRKSTSGYAFILGNGVICWSSKRQQIVALSSTEAEYKVAIEACKEALWLRQLVEDLRFNQVLSTIIKCDNRSSIALTQNPQFLAKTKHIEIQHHFIREKIQDEQVNI
jgi:hypothetical protein